MGGYAEDVRFCYGGASPAGRRWCFSEWGLGAFLEGESLFLGEFSY